jgi:hypothetical protein
MTEVTVRDAALARSHMKPTFRGATQRHIVASVLYHRHAIRTGFPCCARQVGMSCGVTFSFKPQPLPFSNLITDLHSFVFIGYDLALLRGKLTWTASILQMWGLSRRCMMHIMWEKPASRPPLLYLPSADRKASACLQSHRS